MSEVSTLQSTSAIHDQPSPSVTPDTSPKGSPETKSCKKELPPHWERVVSDQHGRYYYWNKETGKTSWKFPEEEAKEHQKKVRSHLYMNVSKNRRTKASSPAMLPRMSTPDNDSPTDNRDSADTAKMSNGGGVTEEGNGSPQPQDPVTVQPVPKRRTVSQGSYVNVEIRNGGSPLLREPSTPISPLPTDSQLSFTRADSDPSSTGPLSPTPPLPSRNYSESDMSLSPPPPLPDRGYESTSSPSEIDNFFPEAHTDSIVDSEGQRSLQNGGNSADEQAPVVKHTVSVQGHEYAVVDRGFKSQEEPDSPLESVTSPPPLPLRARQRLAQDAHEAGYTEIAVRAQMNRVYVEIDSGRSDDPRMRRQSPKPVAYAVVDISGERERSPLPDPLKRDSPSGKRGSLSSRPRPYEVPSASMENLADPGYEQIREDREQPMEDGYMRVKKDSMHFFQRTSSQEQLDRQRKSTKEIVSLVSPAKDVGASPLSRKDSPSTGRDSPFSQDSVFDSGYDLPSNSNRLQRLNVSLPRGSTPNLTGYSRLGDFSKEKEAILLRSGVTLRRYEQLDSVSSVRSRPDEKSEESCSGSDQDDGLEPVNKAIKSLESSLGVSVDDLSSSPVKMVHAPSGSPSWTKAQRRPHAYEQVNDSLENQFESTNEGAKKRHMTLSSLEMDWDATEFSAEKTAAVSRVKDLSKIKSSSQPNLLKDSDVQFPHLQKPPRVSSEAFKLRVNRLMGHKYEEVGAEEGPPDLVHSAESVGDVNALNSAIKESWLEGDQGKNGGLPKGWKSLKDEHEKQYYWHVPTGRTQYEKPSGVDVKRLSLSVDDRYSVGDTPPGEGEKKKRPHPTFKAQFIGSQDVDESELIQGQCVKVVHSCIDKVNSEPSTSVASGEDQIVFLQVHNASLRWLDPETSTPTLTQPINKIRVWGIGLNNEKDFGYVARNIKTNKHQCHLFRCERPARAVARALLEAHQKERQERRTKKALQKNLETLAASGEQTREPSGSTESKPVLTPPKGGPGRSPPVQSDVHERITCKYLGSCDVFQSQGMQVVNEAVSKLCAESGRKVVDVHLDVATSSIRILDARSENVIGEHRVRFLCFLGIAKDDRFCGYILDCGTKNNVKQLKFHGFLMEPNTDRLCLVIHKACQARYKRVLESNPDARRQSSGKKEEPLTPTSKSSPNLFGRLGSLKKTKKPLQVEDDSPRHSFVVQYLGCQGVSKAEGLDAVRVPLQQMALPKTQSRANPPFLVNFDVSPRGVCITDPGKQVFNKKNFAVKNITYIVRVRNYFAFISKDNGKLNCHVFAENEVDAGTVVSTIEKILVPRISKSPTK